MIQVIEKYNGKLNQISFITVLSEIGYKITSALNEQVQKQQAAQAAQAKPTEEVKA